jgi:simple sugar transport system ATP-binding protein
VTHKLVEALSLADEVTVLGRGRVRGGGPASAFDERSLAALMVETSGGAKESATRRARERSNSRSRPAERSVVLAVDHLTHRTHDGRTALDDVSFSIAGGEVLAIAGVEGNGQQELVSAIAGTAPHDGRASRHGRLPSGRILLDGRPIGNPAAARAAGLSVVPADRRREGLVEGLEAWENLLLGSDLLGSATSRGWLARGQKTQDALARFEDFGVRPPDPELLAAAFSGGNQQRIVLARELGRERIRALVAANPTRGLDIAATSAVHRMIIALAAKGSAVLLLSTDLDEVLELGESIAVLYRGRLHGPFTQPVSRTEIGRLMAGAGEAA